MEITPTIILLVGVVCVILGFLASVLLNTLSGETESPVDEVADTPPGGRKGHYLPVVRLWRERNTSKLVVEVDGKSLVAPDPLTDEQRARLEQTARELRAWLGMGMVGIETSGRPEQTSPDVDVYEIGEADLNRAVGLGLSTPATPPPAPAVSSPASSVPPAPGQTSSTPRQSTSAVNPGVVQPPTPKGKDEPAEAPSAKSIVMQVEDILQDMIAGTPLEQRGVHLIEDPARGVIVQVGLARYEGIDSVPDPQIKHVIQSAVQEWEKSQ